MLSVANKPIMLSVANKPIMLSVIMLSVVILSVLAPTGITSCFQNARRLTDKQSSFSMKSIYYTISSILSKLEICAIAFL